MPARFRRKVSGKEQEGQAEWSLFFQILEDWKKQFFISSEPVEIYGVNGWYVDLEFSRFRRPDGTEVADEIIRYAFDL